MVFREFDDKIGCKIVSFVGKGMNKIVNDSQFRRDFSNKTVKTTLSLKDSEKLQELLMKTAMVTAAVKKFRMNLKIKKIGKKR